MAVILRDFYLFDAGPVTVAARHGITPAQATADFDFALWAAHQRLR